MYKLKLKLPEKNTGKIFHDRDIAKDFLKRTPIAQEITPRIDKYAYMKLIRFFTTKEIKHQHYRWPTGWEKIFAK